MSDIGPIWFWVIFWGVIAGGYLGYHQIRKYRQTKRRLRRRERYANIAKLRNSQD